MTFNRNMLSEAVRLGLVVGAAGLFSVTAAPVMAQDSGSEEIRELGTMQVTGSRIKRSVDFETAAPVLSLDRATLEASGLNSVGDVLQDISTGGAALNATFNNGGNGETRVNLRNLGSNRTLVLVNGKRWANTIDGAVDLNTIPTAAIDRVEVLKDGASALYGSDAIGGVVNVITRSDYEGAEITAYVGGYDQGDGDQEYFSATAGASGERSSALFSVSYVNEEPIMAGDREIARVPAFGLPGDIVGTGASSTTRQGRFRMADGGYFVLDQGAAGCASGQVCDPARQGDFRPFRAADGFNYAPENFVLTPSERSAFYGQGDFDVTDNIRARMSTVYNQRKSSQLLAPVPIVMGTGFFGADHPRGFNISADSIYNPFGQDIVRFQLRSPERFPRVFSQDVDTMYFNGSVEGSFELAERYMFWDVGYIYANSERLTTVSGQLNLAILRQQVGPSAIQNGTPVCLDAAGGVISGCVPFNFMGGSSSVTDEMWNNSTFTGNSTNETTMKSYYANLSGDIVDLPAGPLAFAIGYENREYSGADQPDAIIAAGNTTGNASKPTSGSYSVDEFYGELSVPVLADVPGAYMLNLSLATRFSDYSNFGDTSNPKFGLEWRPIEDLLIRGTYAEGFRAPSITELFLGPSDSYPNLADPCSASRIDSFGAEVRARCQAAGVDVGNYQQANNQIRITVGGNQNLQPEEAVSKTLGLVYSPSFFEGFNISLDWYNIELTNAIGQNSAQGTLNDCYLQGDAAACSLISRTGDGVINDLFAGQTNLPGGIETEGYDLTLSYTMDTDYGLFRFNWDNAYVSYYGDIGQDAGDNDVGRYRGRGAAYFRHRSTFNVDWAMGDWGANLGLRYFSPLDEDCQIVREVSGTLNDPSLITRLCSDGNELNDPQHPNQGVNRLDSTVYVDGQVRWNAPWNGTIKVGARNLFDQDPPVSYTTFANSFDPAYDVPGTYWYASYTQRF